MINKHSVSKNSMPQMNLFGLGTKPQHEHHYFFALSPGHDVRLHLSKCAEELRASKELNGSWIASERYHLTLHHLGQYPEVQPDLVSRAMTAAGKTKAKPFDFVLDQFMCFDSRTGKYPCVAASAIDQPDLNNFWQLLGNNLLAVGLGEKLGSSFKPHATLLYNRQPLGESCPIAPIHWHVSDFVLIESLVGMPQHTELGRWPLSA